MEGAVARARARDEASDNPTRVGNPFPNAHHLPEKSSEEVRFCLVQSGLKVWVATRVNFPKTLKVLSLLKAKRTPSPPPA